ncbi:erythromycin esterase family protein [Actinoplanes sp. NPDC051851]|uniref:erythromycin esterase family protein n=1 Tax=Actinoplanes sp. NPDC051851 TaxID=3154753 RepID=UPI00342711EC
MAVPLEVPDDLGVLLDRIGGARVVLLGEATHGTHEFYTWRAAITRRLIDEAGFSFVAAEADRRDFEGVDRHVRLVPGADADPLPSLGRWPTWMWANAEVADLVRWLRARNAERDPAGRAGFHGLEERSSTEWGGREAWNDRSWKMEVEICRLLELHGPGSRAVVWAHNTHTGDARATRMGAEGGINLGQLVRQRYGRENVALVGFGTHHGMVMAGDSWGAPMRAVALRPARRGSLEAVLHEHAPPRSLFVFPERGRGLRLLSGTLGHRAIGVVYHPELEDRDTYVPTVLGDRYDAFCWFAETWAVRPVPTRTVDTRAPETYPAGV